MVQIATAAINARRFRIRVSPSVLISPQCVRLHFLKNHETHQNVFRTSSASISKLASKIVSQNHRRKDVFAGEINEITHLYFTIRTVKDTKRILGPRRNDAVMKLTGAGRDAPQRLSQRWTDRDGQIHPIGVDEILVVSPYNMQINLRWWSSKRPRRLADGTNAFSELGGAPARPAQGSARHQFPFRGSTVPGRSVSGTGITFL
jgi:hypothetical protein